MKKKIIAFFSTKSGDKRVPNITRIFTVLAGILFVGGLSSTAWDYFREQDTSGLIYSRKRPVRPKNPPPQATATDKVKGLFRAKKASAPKPPKKRQRTIPPVKYGAKQVIARPLKVGIPRGTTAQAVLASPLDTREKGLVRAILPQGVRVGGEGRLPLQTALFGAYRYAGRGKKISVLFTAAVLPDGRELAVRAQAVLTGEYHANRAAKTATALGLSMAAGTGEVLAQKQALGGFGDVTVKSTFRNALYHGAAKATEQEARRQANEIGKLPPFVTVEQGTAFAVYFTAPVGGGPL